MLGTIWAECIEALGHRGESNVRRLTNVAVRPLVVFAHVDNPSRLIRKEQDVQLFYRYFRNCHAATLLAALAVA